MNPVYTTGTAYGQYGFKPLINQTAAAQVCRCSKITFDLYMGKSFYTKQGLILGDQNYTICTDQLIHAHTWYAHLIHSWSLHSQGYRYNLVKTSAKQQCIPILPSVFQLQEIA